MSILRIIVLGALAYFAYKYYSWPGAIGVIGAYVLLYVILSIVGRMLNASRSRRQAQRIINQKLSDAEKKHLAATSEHNQAMQDHKAQFDPDLRKSRGQ
jgi:Flp pilus assembly protein TadB